MGASMQRSGGTLTGAYTPEVDTHALAGSGGTDTHAANVVNDGINVTNPIDNSNPLTLNPCRAHTNNTSEQTELTSSSITVSTAQNIMYAGIGAHWESGGATTVTLRLRHNSITGTIIASTSFSSGVAGTETINTNFSGSIADVPTGARTVLYTGQLAAGAANHFAYGNLVAGVASGSLSGTAPTDTHSLGGSLTPSSDTHTCS